ncbi:MAG: signal peptidase I [Eubacteriales bacterium]
MPKGRVNRGDCVKNHKTIIKLANSFLLLLMASAFALIIMTLSLKAFGVKLKFKGYFVYRIVTGSMEPDYPIGDYVLVKSIDPDLLINGDVVAFVSQDSDSRGEVIIHRVVGRGENGGIVTMGDANPAADYKNVSSAQVLGRVKTKLGFLRTLDYIFLNAPAFIIVIALPLLLIMGMETYGFFCDKKTSLTLKSYIKSLGLDPNDKELLKISKEFGKDTLLEIAHRTKSGETCPEPKTETTLDTNGLKTDTIQIQIQNDTAAIHEETYDPDEKNKNGKH